MLDQEQEHALLQKAASGCEAAFTVLYKRYEQHVSQVAMVYTKDQDQAQEIVQEVFQKIWEKKEKLADIKDVRDFLFIVARNSIFNQFKKNAQSLAARKNYQYTLQDAINDTDSRIRDHECEHILHRAINGLPPQRKRIYKLAKEEGLSYEEIARRMNISRFTVKNQMIQALQSIRLQLLHYLPTVLILLLIFSR